MGNQGTLYSKRKSKTAKTPSTSTFDVLISSLCEFASIAANLIDYYNRFFTACSSDVWKGLNKSDGMDYMYYVRNMALNCNISRADSVSNWGAA
jgi:hypothetical protein